MYSFEGDFRRKPVQSLRGASKKEEKESLIRRAQIEREKRENVRLRAEMAVVIQSYYRSYMSRKEESSRFRSEFDQFLQNIHQPTDINVNQLFTLIRKLYYFFNAESDGSRLVSICQLVLQKKEDCFGYLVQNCNSGVIQINHLLILCVRYLNAISSTQSPIAVPMRMLEVFTLSENYKNTARNPVIHIWTFLIHKGYFQYFKRILENKVPRNLTPSPKPPTPVAESILDLIMRPINFATNANDKTFSGFVLTEVCQALLCPGYSEQVSMFLVPAMAYGKFPFPFVELIQTLILHTSDVQETKNNVEELCRTQQRIMTPYLLFSLLMFADTYIDSLNTDNSVLFVLLVGRIVSCLHIPNKQYSADDSDSEDEMEMDDMNSGSIGVPYVGTDIEKSLNSPRFIHCVLRCLKHKLEYQVVSSVCYVCYTLMNRHHHSVHRQRLLYSLAFSPSFIRSLWYTSVSLSITTVTGSEVPLIQTLSHGLSSVNRDIKRFVPLLYVFCSMFSHSLYTLHDAEFYGGPSNKGSECSMPFSLSELVPMTLMLRDCCLGIIDLIYPDTKLSVTADYREALRLTGVIERKKYDQEQQMWMWIRLFKIMATLVRQLYTRDTRRTFCPNSVWLSDRVHIQVEKPSQLYKSNGSVFTNCSFDTMKSLTQGNLDSDGPPLSNTDVKHLVILTELPFVVSFEERFKILQKFIQNDREENQGELHHFLTGPSINVMIRRNFIYEDAFDKLSPENESNLKLKMRVQLMNAAGLEEAGIDGGGVFREFLSELLKTGFDPNRGLFTYTTDRLLYPNPQSAVLMENYTKHFYFLGRMLGKAMYENLLVELPFASFFLSKILSLHGSDLDIHHLASLDPEMYRNLLSIKNYDGDITDLNLDFTVVNDNFGQTKVVDLKPGGSNIAVNNNNKIEYIHLMADYKINKQIRVHCQAFRHGMADLINLEWLRMFDPHELQVIISGALVPIDIEDLKRYTNYSGGYAVDHPTIVKFWRAVESFTDEQKRKLLKFVTSCSRPPLLGFKDLYPPFSIHYGGNETDRLPTASTCMNLLKLPEFRDDKTMKDKLLYAFESEAGFELS